MQGGGLLRRARPSSRPARGGAGRGETKCRCLAAAGVDAVLITASGCGTVIKDYGFMLREDQAYAAKAAGVSAMALDITEYLDAPWSCRLRRAPSQGRLSLRLFDAARPENHAIAEGLAGPAGFEVRDVPEGHLCCGSAGTYNMLQPEIAAKLRDRKVANIEIDPPRCDRDRQYRLHHADRSRHDDPDRAHRRTSGLGDRRSATETTRQNARKGVGLVLHLLRRRFRHADVSRKSGWRHIIGGRNGQEEEGESQKVES